MIPDEYGEHPGILLFDEGEICIEVDVSSDPNRSIHRIY